jgi:hypothetical protein
MLRTNERRRSVDAQEVGRMLVVDVAAVVVVVDELVEVEEEVVDELPLPPATATAFPQPAKNRSITEAHAIVYRTLTPQSAFTTRLQPTNPVRVTR